MTAATELYTDGSCPRNDGRSPGGWAFVVVFRGQEYHGSGAVKFGTTNNRMELEAVIQGLCFVISKGYHTGVVNIVSDSQYVLNGMSKWCNTWRKNNWMTAGRRGIRQQVKNTAQWKRLYELSRFSGIRCTYQWQRGHVGHRYNELCDMMAGQAVWDLIEHQ